MQVSVEREKVRFASGDTECVAWHYPGTNGACVVMAGGFAVTKEPGTDMFAKRFHDAGFAVLAFDYRRIGESGGQPRQVLPVRDQLADWQAAIAFARTLPGVDAARLAVWAFSASGGHVLRVAAGIPELGPDSLDGDRALRAGRYPDWQRTVAARSALRLVFYRPGRSASRVRSPLLVLVCDQDRTTPAGPTIRATQRAPRAELVRIPGGHYEPFLGGHEQAVEAQLSFLRRHLLDPARADRSAAATVDSLPHRGGRP